MKKIILIRHGAIDTKYTGRYIGATDVPLSAQGIEESLAIGRYIANIQYDHIFASPMLRVRQTLETAIKFDKQVAYMENLREVNFGDWEGKSFAEIAKNYPAAVNDWVNSSDSFTFPHGSNLKDFYCRVEQFKQSLLNTSGSTIIVFTHGGVVLALICTILGLAKNKMLAFKVDRGSISILNLFENGYGILDGINIKPMR
jgi:broad specificity phosphatase PhoE